METTYIIFHLPNISDRHLKQTNQIFHLAKTDSIVVKSNRLAIHLFNSPIHTLTGGSYPIISSSPYLSVLPPRLLHTSHSGHGRAAPLAAAPRGGPAGVPRERGTEAGQPAALLTLDPRAPAAAPVRPRPRLRRRWRPRPE